MQSHDHKHLDSGLPSWLALGFSGHRRMADEQRLRDAFAKIVNDPRLAGYRFATVSSAACGSDTVFLEEAVERDYPRFIILPFARETFSKDFTPQEWDRALPLINSATDCEVFAGDTPRSEAFFDAGIMTVDRCDIFIVYWNGKPAAGKGGTADTVDYARLIGKPLIIIPDVSGELIYENFESLKLVPQSTQAKDTAHLQPYELLKSEYDRLSHIAILHGPKSRNIVAIIIFIHLIASAIASGTLVFLGIEDHSAWSVAAAIIKVSALTYALVLARSHHHAHASWLYSRVGSELCRSYMAIWKLRRCAQVIPDTEGLNVDSLAKNLRILWYLDRDKAANLQQAKEDYLKNRVDDQREYFERQSKKARPTLFWGKRLALAGTIGTIISIILCWTVLLHHSDGTYYKVAKLLSLILPLMSAAILSYVLSLDTSRRTIRYQEMIDALGTAKTKINVTQTWPGLSAMVADTERKLLREVGEWYAVARYGGESH